MKNLSEDLVTITEIARIFGVKRSVVCGWRHMGYLPNPVRDAGYITSRKYYPKNKILHLRYSNFKADLKARHRGGKAMPRLASAATKPIYIDDLIIKFHKAMNQHLVAKQSSHTKKNKPKNTLSSLKYDINQS